MPVEFHTEPINKMKAILGDFHVDLSDAQKHPIIFHHDSNADRVMVVIVTSEYPGGYGIVVDGKSARILAHAFAAAHGKVGDIELSEASKKMLETIEQYSGED